jgi:hypothetical protein
LQEFDPTTNFFWQAFPKTNQIPIEPSTFRRVISALFVDTGIEDEFL